MDCPRCCHKLVPTLVHQSTEIDVCRHCGGSFLAPEEASELLGAITAPETWIDSEVCKDQGEAKLLSPITSKPMHEYTLYYQQPVTVDRCVKSGGIWLDAGEGDRLREILEDASQSETNHFGAQKPEFKIGSYLLQFFSGIPLEVWHPKRKFPVCTVSIIVSCCLIFLFQVISLLIFGDEMGKTVVELAALSPQLFSGHAVWGLITYMFLHGGIAHLFGNMALLYILGDNVEDKLGATKFLVLYVVSGLLGGVAQVAIPSETLPVVGASGAVAGVMSAYWIMFPRVRIRMVILGAPIYMGVKVYFGFWLLMNVVMAIAGGGGVAWFCHLGGFAAGLVIAWPYRRRYYAQLLEPARLS